MKKTKLPKKIEEEYSKGFKLGFKTKVYIPQSALLFKSEAYRFGVQDGWATHWIMSKVGLKPTELGKELKKRPRFTTAFGEKRPIGWRKEAHRRQIKKIKKLI